VSIILYNRYDTDNSGELDREQLKKLLTDLNDGLEIIDEEVDDIMLVADTGKSGTIDKTELIKAISVWFSETALSDDPAPTKETANDPKPENPKEVPAAAPVKVEVR